MCLSGWGKRLEVRRRDHIDRASERLTIGPAHLTDPSALVHVASQSNSGVRFGDELGA